MFVKEQFSRRVRLEKCAILKEGAEVGIITRKTTAVWKI